VPGTGPGESRYDDVREDFISFNEESDVSTAELMKLLFA
jgi:hypothetical protein